MERLNTTSFVSDRIRSCVLLEGDIMSIVRISHDKTNPYVMLNKKVLEDTNISWAAKGLWSYLMSRPDNWNVSVSHLVKLYNGRGGKETAIYALINELVEFGYCQKIQNRNEIGKFKNFEYVISEFKNKVPHLGLREAGNPDPVKQGTNNKRSLKKNEERTNEDEDIQSKNEDVRSFSSEHQEKIREVLTAISLEEDKIPSFFKYPVDEVVKAAAYCSRNLKTIRNLGGYLNDCILKSYKPKESAEEVIEENVKFLKTLKHLDGKTVGYYNVYVGNKYIEIVSGSKCDRFEIKSKTFVKNVSERLATLKYTV